MRRHSFSRLKGLACFEGRKDLPVRDPSRILLSGKQGEPVDIFEREFQATRTRWLPAISAILR